MIDLKSVINQYPEYVQDGKKIKSLLSDLYPSESLYASILCSMLDDGIVDEIKNKQQMDKLTLANLSSRMEKKHGYAQKYIDGCLSIWANALGIKIVVGQEPLKIVPIKKPNKKEKEIDATIHTHKYKTIKIAPTCTEQGYTLYRCDCGYEYKNNFVQPKHDYVLVEYIEPTCETDGRERYKCANCGEEKVVVLKATGHKFGQWIEQEKPTCEKDGFALRQCKRCGKTERKTIDATGHNFSEWRQEDGDYVRYCPACGFKEKKGLPIETVGQIVEFGRYPQTRDGEILPIKWKVLKIKNKKAFLLSKNTLDQKPYDSRFCETSPLTQSKTVTWSNSYIRQWLNTDFLNKAFLDNEKKSIVRTNNTNVVYTLKVYEIHSVLSPTQILKTERNVSKTISASTTDLVFLPSMNDIEQLYEFKYGGNYLGYGENHLDLKGKNGLDDDCIWALRDLEYYSTTGKISGREFISDISYGPLAVSHRKWSGEIYFVNENKDEYAIRPAMWVDLSTTEEKEQELKEEQERKRLEEARKEEQSQLERERAIKVAEDKKKEECLKKERRDKGVCQYCGGKFEGWLIKKCSTCGKRKDY